MRTVMLLGSLALFGLGCLNIVAPLSSLGGQGADAGRDTGPDAGTAFDAGDAGDDAGPSCLPDSGIPNTCVVLSAPIFGTATPQTDQITSWGFAVGDLNNDGIADLVKVGWTLGDITSGEVFTYYGLSDGGLRAGPPSPPRERSSPSETWTETAGRTSSTTPPSSSTSTTARFPR